MAASVALDAFTRAYTVAALWSSTNDEGQPLDDAGFSLEDFAPETLERVIADCSSFQQENAGLLARAVYRNGSYSDAEMAGHDFWLTRNHHGAGFWDRNELPEEVGKRLTEVSEEFGEAYLYVGDDGKLYF